ncbi:MAG: hypothetical protein AAGF95_30765 [Chloroflexota bacterium]
MVIVLNLLVCLAATLYMTGVIWMVQLAHYPLFAQVGTDAFATYHQAHQQRTGLVVMLPMMIEAITTGMLLFLKPSVVPFWLVWLGIVLLAVIWGMTFFIQIPYHGQLALSSASERIPLINGLVVSNWWRTFAWTARSVLLLIMVALVMLHD